MSFVTPAFALFVLAFVVLFHVMRRHADATRVVVIAASLVFYGSFSVGFVPLLLASSLVTFLIGRALATADAARKKRLLAAGVGFCLALLAVFKYANFVLENLYALARAASWDVTELYLDVTFPIGISFYTFVNVAYLVDVYRKQVPAKQRALEFFAPMTFFPHLLSGPIVRAPQLLPQFDRLTGMTTASLRLGVLLLFIGVIKKQLSAFLEPIVAAGFAADAQVSELATWTGVLAYTAQIYVDFSGYTDIVLGVASLCGIALPANFDLPYLATSPADFWRRWHISLSSWIHDYLFLPIVRKLRRTYVALLLTWFLVGVWHGPQWTFVAYGVYHGVAIIVTRVIGLRVPDAIHDRADAWPVWTLRWLTTFFVINVGFIVFRSPDLLHAGHVTASLFSSSAESVFSHEAVTSLGIVVLALVIPHVVDGMIAGGRERIGTDPLFWWWLLPLVLAAILFFVVHGSPEHNQFIYTRF